MTPQILSARTVSAAPTATGLCTMPDSGLMVPPAYISADMPLAQKKAIYTISRIMIMTAGLKSELLAGLMFVDPSKDWKTHMQQLLPIENPRGMAGLAKQKFAGSYRYYREFVEFD